MIRPTIAALALLVVPVSLFAQADNTVAPPTDAGSQTTSAPPFVASYLLIKADWSQSPAAKDIDADLRKALNRDIVSKDKFEALPKSAAAILFPTENAAVYSQEHYTQFLAWLKEKQLIDHTRPIPIHGSSFTYQYPGREPVSIGMAMLFKNADFSEPEESNGSQAARKFMWSISATTIGNWSLSYGPILDRTKSPSRPRADESQTLVPEPGTEYDGGRAYFPPPREGQAVILHAFPPMEDANLRAAVDGRGLLALMVIEKEQSSNRESPKPRFWVPDSSRRIAAARIRGTYSRVVDNTKPETDSAADADSRSIATGSQIISWSPEKDETWGFSKSLNKRDRQVLSPPAKAKPWVKEHVALWSLESSFCAYSATAGRWDVLHVPNAGAIVSVSDEYALINVDDKIYTFTASSGRWSSNGESALAQQQPQDDVPPRVASLLLIRFDWSQSPAWKEIEAELRKALGGEAVTKEDLAKLPNSWPRILFPVSAVSIYSQQHYAQLLAWLKARQLVVQIEPFTNNKLEPGQVPLGGWYAPTLSKSYEFFGLTAPQAQSDLFFTRTTEFTWSVSDTKVERELAQYEKGRGQEEFQPMDRNSFDRCQFTFNRLEDGQVMIAPAFPDIMNDREFRTATKEKGFEAMIVVEQGRAALAAPPQPQVRLPDKVERINAHRMQGSRSLASRENWPQAAQPKAAVGTAARSIISKNVMISWSEAKDVAWGFSESMGKWAEQKMDPAATNSAPLVAEDIAVWRVGNDYYAFSSQAARWDALRLPKDHSPSAPATERGFVRVHDGDDVYTFSGSTGRWSSPKGSAEATESKPEETQFKIFALRNAKAIEAQVLINQLFAHDIHSAVADERLNSLIVRGPPEQLNVIFAILTRLDEDLGGNQAARADGPRTGLPKGQGGMFGTVFEPSPSAETVEELAKKYNDKEQQAQALARQIRELQSAPEPHKQPIREMTVTLRRLVGEAFAARQELHHAEVGQLQQRIAGIQRNVAARDKLSDKIIDVRVNDLLNPELQWESSSRLPGGAVSPGARAASMPSTARPNVTIGPSWGPESEQILQELGIQVQKLTPDDAPEQNLVGALKITSIAPDSPARELQVGEVIRGLQTTSGSRKGWRRVEIHFRRGNQSLSVVFELPNQALFSATPATNATFATSPGKGTTTVPGLNMPVDAKATTIRSAEEFHRKFDSALSKVDSIKDEPLSRYEGQDAAEQAANKKWYLDRAERELAFVRDEHAAQLRLLELEVQDASSAIEAAAQQHKLTQQEFASGHSTRGNLLGQERAVQEADLRLQRAKILLDLYRKADPKDAAVSPAAEPASIPAPNAAPRR